MGGTPCQCLTPTVGMAFAGEGAAAAIAVDAWSPLVFEEAEPVEAAIVSMAVVQAAAAVAETLYQPRH